MQLWMTHLLFWKPQQQPHQADSPVYSESPKYGVLVQLPTQSIESSLKGHYIARHDRLVDLIAAQIPCVADEKLYKHNAVQSDCNTSLGIPDTPDIVVISQYSITVKLFEVI